MIKSNEVWLGATRHGTGQMWFRVPDDAPEKTGQRVDNDGVRYQTIGDSAWFTNIEHGLRHEPLDLMTLEDNLRYSKNSKIRAHGYRKYDNYDAIEVPAVVAIPSDYKGVMGVPITFVGKYTPEQFEILGSRRWAKSDELLAVYTGSVVPPEDDRKTLIDGKETYDRIFIRHRRPEKEPSQ